MHVGTRRPDKCMQIEFFYEQLNPVDNTWRRFSVYKTSEWSRVSTVKGKTSDMGAF